VKQVVAVILCGLLAACGNPPKANSTPAGNDDPGTFGGKPKANAPANAPEPEGTGITVVVDVNDVGRFRGTKMAQLLQSLDSEDTAQWKLVRRYVHPRPTAPEDYDAKGKLIRQNFDWPPKDQRNPNDQQKAWRSYLLWPLHVRELMHKPDWDAEANRQHLARIGRLYELTWKFQQTPEYASPTLESEHWRQYAESMLAYGEEGQTVLVSNMILALTNPSEDTVRNAQSVLVQVGDPAIEQLCGALWIGFRQAAVLDDGSRTVQANPNFNKYVIDTLYRIGGHSVSQAIYELENTLDENKQARGSAWRFRKHFIELLGKLGDAKCLPTLEAEITRVKIEEYDAAQLARGKQVVDKEATEDARFVFGEYLLQAFSGIRSPNCLRGIIRVWEQDDFHENGAIDAVFRCTGKRVRSIQDVKDLAAKLKVDLKG